jgi:hypothetical protein
MHAREIRPKGRWGQGRRRRRRYQEPTFAPSEAQPTSCA